VGLPVAGDGERRDWAHDAAERMKSMIGQQREWPRGWVHDWPHGAATATAADGAA
jgi:hypothetical protein